MTLSPDVDMDASYSFFIPDKEQRPQYTYPESLYSKLAEVEVCQKYIENIYSRIFPMLVNKLNSLHGVNHSDAYWSQIISLWLYSAIAITYDRWRSVDSLALKSGSNYFSHEAIQEPVFFTFQDFQEKMARNDCNKYLFFQILESRGFEPISLPSVQQRMDSLKKKVTKRYFTNLKIFCYSMYNFMAKKLFQNYWFFDTYVEFSALFRFSLFKLGCGYVHSHEFRNLDRFGHETPHKESELEFEKQNEFEVFLATNIFKMMPLSYGPNFLIFKKAARRIGFPKHGVFTASLHLWSDMFNIWAAEFSLLGDKKLYLMQHGGGIPKVANMFLVQEKHSHRFLVWHKAILPRHHRIPMQKRENLNGVPGLREHLTLVLFNGLKCPVRCQCAPTGIGMLSEISQKRLFLKSLDRSIFDQVVVRAPKAREETFDLECEFSDIIELAKFDRRESFGDSLKVSKVVICGYPQTCFTEAILSETPTILLIQRDMWQFADWVFPVVKLLEEAKILFNDSILASNHVAEIWSDPVYWWESRIVREAVDAYRSYCANDSGLDCSFFEEFI